jgi:enoyl-CoA hydratase/carnithine racemase
MSNAQRVDLRRDGPVATVTLSNPPRHTLTADGVAGLHRAMDQIEQDEALRVLVLTGGGEGVFVAHYEVGELADAAEAGSARDARPGEGDGGLHPFHALCLRLEALPAITVAALNGNAAGGGCELSLACDFRLLADGPYHYGLPETSVGIIPGAGGTQRFARLLGTARALDLILHARLLTPAEALALGLVHRVFAEASFRAEVDAFVADLAARAPIALRAAKRAIRRGAELPLAEGLAVEQNAFARTMRSKDAAGAMRAFLRGEPWTWMGE